MQVNSHRSGEKRSGLRRYKAQVEQALNQICSYLRAAASFDAGKMS